MFGTLMKHEWKSSWRVLGLINIIFVAATLFGCVFLGLDVKFSNPDIKSYVNTILLTMYILMFVALMLIGTLYFVVHFYKNVYSSEGYLTHTLPVTHLQILNSRILISLIWMFITSVVGLLSVAALIFAYGREQVIGPFHEALSLISRYHAGGVVACFLLLLFVSTLQKLLSYYFCISLGQLSNRNKVGWSIVAFVVLSVITSVVTQVTTLAFGLTADHGSIFGWMNGMSVQGVACTTMLIGSGLLLVTCVIFYAVCAYIMKKKINLE